MGLTVREARQRDVQEVATLAEQAWREAYEGTLRPATIDAAIAEWYDPGLLRESLEEGDALFYVAHPPAANDGPDGLVGFLRGRLGEEVAHLGAIYAHPDRLGEGIGSAMLDRFESACADHGYETIELAVLADNDVGQSFYHTRGYEPVEDREVELFGETVEDRVFRGTCE